MKRSDIANIANAEYVDDFYARYLEDPSSVSEDWALFFAGFELGRGSPPPAPAPDAPSTDPAPAPEPEAPQGARPLRRAPARNGGPQPTLGVFDLVHSYRELGHLIADLNPLGHNETTHPLLEISEFGFDESDLSRPVQCPTFQACESATLGELRELLHKTYCGTVAVEYMYISNKEHREWIQERIEPNLNQPQISAATRRRILSRVMRAEAFERFLHTKFVGQKRFSLEGGEALIPLLDELIEASGNRGVREIVLAMPHRGRINVLTHVLRKPYTQMFAEYEGSFLPKSIQGDGDVKYHLGYSHDAVTREGHDVHLSLLFNPSHLEAIDPVAEGIVAGKQHYLQDSDGSQVMPVLLHGDAAFMGQGLVMETLSLSELPYYRTGGTVHIIINNQIGFTTSPEHYRFTRYPTEIAKLVQAPVLHANADDPEAVVHAAGLAAEFRAAFKEDILIDLVCYRRHGHNELDDPTFTQPTMYKTIKAKSPVHELYRDRLLAEGVITEQDYAKEEETIKDSLEKALDFARDFMPKQQVFSFGGAWKGMSWAGEEWDADTTVARRALERVADRAAKLPEGFTPHRKIKQLIEQRKAMVAEGKGIDWGCAEMLAIGTLLLEGTTVRLSGQDSGRGTFSHRHAALHDNETGERLVPLDKMTDQQGRFILIDSNLSEAGVLGFEYGFSSADPRNLVIWEAQFGDFANGAQVIIDQFIATAESKWQRLSGLVMLVPHGYEGQGPEHSSARLERYLNACAENNIQVCNLTTPAQLFHVLRRQMHRTFRKPLIIMSPKSMLRHKLCVSDVEEFTQRSFQAAIDDTVIADASKVRRILFCSGKVYYDLFVAREDRGIDDVAIVRVEQLYPFPTDQVREIIGRYPADAEVFWVQEEPKNMGAWRFVSDRDHTFFDNKRSVDYVGRRSAASPASGSYKVHNAELAVLIDEAFRAPQIRSVRSGHVG